MNDIFEKAVDFAVKAHSGQTRKSAKTPYILHPMEVAAIASTLTDDVEILCAALLHDTVEDTSATVEDIYDIFGDRIARLVQGDTEEEYKDIPRAQTWRIRKEESLQHLRTTDDIAVKILWLSDKLSNMRAFYRLYLEKGVENMWEGFNQRDPAEQKWYYTTIAELLDELSDTDAYQEYLSRLNKVFEEVS